MFLPMRMPKRLAGEAAAELVKSGMVVGLGTGSTVAWTIKRLGERVKEEGLDFLGSSHLLSGRESGHRLGNKAHHAQSASSP